MQLGTIIYGIAFTALIIVIAVVSIIASRRYSVLEKQCPPIPPILRSVMGIHVNYREEEKEIKQADSSLARLTRYNNDAANEVAMILMVALMKWTMLPARREVPAGYCEADWRNRTWRQAVQDVGLPLELYEDVMDIDYRFVKSFKTTFGQFKDALSRENSTENKFIEARKKEFKAWLDVRNNFVAADVEKYMNALRQYNEFDYNTSMDIRAYGEVAIIQPQLPTAAPAPACICPDKCEDPTKNGSKSSTYNLYSTQQRIAFMILFIVAIICLVAIILEEVWRLSPRDTL